MPTGGGSSPASTDATCHDVPGCSAPAASYAEEKRQELMRDYASIVLPKLRPIVEKDDVKQFTQLYDGWSHLMAVRGLLLPEVLSSMVSSHALRCARAALKGGAPLRGRRADPNGRHRYGFAPLHLAAEAFDVDMVRLLLQHGASASHRTEGDRVVQGLLPLHVAVENASMHKYLEDNWAHGDHVVKLLFLLCLPEMKMYLDTTRLIAKHTDNIVDELWTYVDEEKVVQLAILLLAAQKQLRGHFNKGRGKFSLNGFDMVKGRVTEALNSLHLEELAMVEEGKKGRALKKLRGRKEILFTARTLVCIVQKVGEALEEYFQIHSKVPHEEIVEHVSSILKSNGILHLGKGIDTGNLECYQYHGQMSVDKSVTQRDSGSKPSEGLAMKDVRNMFFPYWKSVLSARLQVKIAPPCQPSRKDMQSSEPSKKGKQSTDQPCSPNETAANPDSIGLARLASNYECRRTFCAVASRSLKWLRHT